MTAVPSYPCKGILFNPPVGTDLDQSLKSLNTDLDMIRNFDYYDQKFWLLKPATNSKSETIYAEIDGHGQPLSQYFFRVNIKYFTPKVFQATLWLEMP